LQRRQLVPEGRGDRGGGRRSRSAGGKGRFVAQFRQLLLTRRVSRVEPLQLIEPFPRLADRVPPSGRRFLLGPREHVPRSIGAAGALGGDGVGIALWFTVRKLGAQRAMFFGLTGGDRFDPVSGVIAHGLAFRSGHIAVS
ncbi:MAG: hypothetical protein K0Q71_5536, partial [Thermomicrobiales bacterium]|nr:hypothetical protein [Thermomicrobiales bacterium]